MNKSASPLFLSLSRQYETLQTDSRTIVSVEKKPIYANSPWKYYFRLAYVVWLQSTLGPTALDISIVLQPFRDVDA